MEGKNNSIIIDLDVYTVYYDGYVRYKILIESIRQRIIQEINDNVMCCTMTTLDEKDLKHYLYNSFESELLSKFCILGMFDIIKLSDKYFNIMTPQEIKFEILNQIKYVLRDLLNIYVCKTEEE